VLLRCSSHKASTTSARRRATNLQRCLCCFGCSLQRLLPIQLDNAVGCIGGLDVGCESAGRADNTWYDLMS
jgi:hypothetical protein